MSITTEVHRKIYDDSDGTFLNVGPDADGLAIVTVWASNEDSRSKYFSGGFMSIAGTDMAVAVGEAIIKCSHECETLLHGEKP